MQDKQLLVESAFSSSFLITCGFCWGTANVPPHQYYSAWFECRRLYVSASHRVAGQLVQSSLSGPVHCWQVTSHRWHCLWPMYSPADGENNSQQSVFSPPPKKLISKWHTLLPPTPSVFLKMCLSALLCLCSLLSFFFTWVTWVVAVMCPSCANYQQPVVFVFTSVKVQLIILKLLTPPALEQLLCLLSSSLCPVFISCANTLRTFETKHCTVWKCHSLANPLWVFLQ